MRRHLLVLAAYAVLTILVTWPLAAQFLTAVPGGGDAWQHLWNLWWMRRSGMGLNHDPFATDVLYYPYGVSLLFHTLVPLEAALTVPGQLLGIELVPLYNSVLFLSFVLAGYATWLLVRDLTGHDGAAFVAGAAFSFCPYHLGHLLGHMNLVSLQWIPFYLWALLRAAGAPGSRESLSPLRRERLGWAVLAGLFLAANAWTEWIYALFLALFTTGYVVWRTLVDFHWREWPPLLSRLLVIGGVALALAGPLFVSTIQAQEGQTWMKFPPRETLFYSSDLLDSFVPSGLHPWWGEPARELERRQPERNTAERSVFVGYTVLALAALGLRRGRGGGLFWGVAALGAWLLSLGPILHVEGRATFTAFNSTIPLPYLVFYSLVPGFSVMRVPARFIVLASLALAVLVGYALAGLPLLRTVVATGTGQTKSRILRLALYGSVIALMSIEFLVVPLRMSAPAFDIPFYHQLAAEPGRFAVLELPLRPMSDYMAYQTIHGKPLVHGYLSRQPPDRFLEETPVLQYLLNRTPADALSPGEAAAGAGTLAAAGVRYAVVHWWAFTEEEATAMRAKLAVIFPGQPPLLEDAANRMTVYRLAR